MLLSLSATGWSPRIRREPLAHLSVLANRLAKLATLLRIHTPILFVAGARATRLIFVIVSLLRHATRGESATF